MSRLKRHKPKKIKDSKNNISRNSITDIRLIWRVLFYLSSAISLTLVFVNNGWEVMSNKNIYIKGNNYLENKTIINAAEISYPINLLALNPKIIKHNLKTNLSLESVSINRQIISNKLIINVLERDPIAYANRISEKGFEKGMIDKNGIWIPFTFNKKILGKGIDLEVEGWTEEQREWISLIILHRNNLGSPLKRIMLSPNGKINLQTKGFELVRLGANRNLLKDQIKILFHLHKTLPSKFINQPGSTIDLRDPSKPEVKTPKKILN